jgi:hypothetical protein
MTEIREMENGTEYDPVSLASATLSSMIALGTEIKKDDVESVVSCLYNDQILLVRGYVSKEARGYARNVRKKKKPDPLVSQILGESVLPPSAEDEDLLGRALEVVDILDELLRRGCVFDSTL